jgi:hypothetical protein
VAVGEKTLWVDEKLAVAAGADDRRYPLGGFGSEGVAWGDDGNAHAPAYEAAATVSAIF